jgi:hypothetical protein
MAKECSSKIVSHPLCPALAHRIIAASSSSHLPLCLSVCLSIYYQGKRKWKGAKELTKNEKTAKTRSKKKKKKKNQIGMRKERERCVIVVVVPSFLPSFLHVSQCSSKKKQKKKKSN